MVSIEGSLERRRRRGQNEIDVLVRKFSESGLSQKDSALKVGVDPLTVTRWVESCAGKPLTDYPTSNSSASPFVSVHLQSGRPVPNTADPDWPEVVAPNDWKLRVPPWVWFNWVGELFGLTAPLLSFLSNTRVYLTAGATDLRKSFDTLAGVVRNSLRLDPLSGHLVVVTNSRKNRTKILFWDKSGRGGLRKTARG